MFIRYGYNAQGKYVRTAIAYTAEEHSIDLTKVDSNAIHIVECLQKQGYESYLVGGAVRDLLLGNTPKDFDIATVATPLKIRSIFRNSRIIGRRFRLVHIYVGRDIYEVSTFRSTQDGSVGNRYGKIEEDVMRRDFSCNALYYDPVKQLLIDYVEGFKDIQNKVLKPVISRKIIFKEDPVRLIRAIKYACTTKSKIPLLLKLQIRREAYLLENVSPSRLTEEINKICFSSKLCEIIQMLFDYGLYNYLQPNACIFLNESKGFYNSYFSSLQELNNLIISGHIKYQSQFLQFLIRDYIALISNIKYQTKKELYNFVYRETRHFILPMNPQRKELEVAVRACLKKLNNI